MATMIVISSDLQSARDAEQRLLDEVADHSYSQAATFAIKLALEEGLNNAIRHGNGFDPNKTVELAYEVDDLHTVIVIRDQGSGFNPDRVPDPTMDENLEKPCGRGIMLMRAYMDDVRFNETGNEVRMVKNNT